MAKAKEAPVEEPKKKGKKKDTAEAVALEIGKMAQVNTDEWQEMLDDMATESNDPRIYFIKPGRNRLRLVPENNDPKLFFHKFSRTYDGKVTTKFLIRGVVMSKRKKDSDEVPRVVAIPVGKVVMKSLLNQLAEGYDLFSPDKGRGVTIVKSGEGIQGTSYTVLISPDPVKIPAGTVDLKESLVEMAQVIEEGDRERAKNTRTNRMGKGKRDSEEDSDTSAW